MKCPKCEEKIKFNVVRPYICKDGFKISIQASFYHYCSPEITGLPLYETYELSCAYDNLLKKYDACGVYARVPLMVVAKLIKKHGGLINEKGKVN